MARLYDFFLRAPEVFAAAEDALAGRLLVVRVLVVGAAALRGFRESRRR